MCLSLSKARDKVLKRTDMDSILMQHISCGQIQPINKYKKTKLTITNYGKCYHGNNAAAIPEENGEKR